MFDAGFDDQRKRKVTRPPHYPAAEEDGEVRNGDAMIAQDLLGEDLVVGHHKAGRIASGERPAHEPQIPQDVRDVQSFTAELLEEVEDDVGVPVEQRPAEGGELVDPSHVLDLVPQIAQRRDDVVLGLPGRNLLVAQLVDTGRKLHRLVAKHQHAQLHTATPWVWLCT